ncbi:nuclease [Novosphingobium sp. M1R2S20]|uniref:Nuclease n=1 Tax=Novosphingobium rhizovicinum TaxID=3228928 RepID=A0ABV3REI7_9SPHN
MRHILAAAAGLALLVPHAALAWGERGHAVIDTAAIEAIPDDGPVFLKKYADYIAASASQPDSWRGNAEGFSKIIEDPNHGWFREQFTFLKPIPRSRYEFVLALYDRHQQIKDSDPQTAARTNVRWTGTLPYAAMEAYDRIVVCMRQVRKLASQGRDPKFAEQNCAFDVARLGHYIGDGANPMHNSIHSDGWRGDNPEGFTTDRSVHGRFESQFVDKIGLTAADILPRMGAPARQRGDMFDLVLAYLEESGDKVAAVYRLEQRDGFADAADRDVREMVYERAAAGAAMLRDMLCRAWVESANPPADVKPAPLDFDNPAFNSATGSAPAAPR